MDYYACGVSPIDELRGSEEWLRIHREPGRQIEMIRYADMLKLYSPIPQMLGHYVKIAVLSRSKGSIWM